MCIFSTLDMKTKQDRRRNGRKWRLVNAMAMAITSSSSSSSWVSYAFPVSRLQGIRSSASSPITRNFVSVASSFDDSLWINNVTDMSWRGWSLVPLRGPPPLPTCFTTKAVQTNIEVSSTVWEEDFAVLVAYRQKKGHFIISKTSDPRLYNFCKNLRQNYKNNLHQLQQRGKLETEQPVLHQNSLTVDRIRSLDEIGFPWTPRDDTWNTKYEQLKFHFYQNGHCQLPSTRAEYRELRQWVSYQRFRYRNNETSSNLSQEQVHLLQEIQFSWTPQEERWWAQFRQLELFVKTHGNYGIHGRENTKLRCYKNTLRRHCREYVQSAIMEGTTHGVRVSGLTPERLDALRRIRFCWLPQPGTLTETPPVDIFEGYQ